jgi:hypothetical protein
LNAFAVCGVWKRGFRVLVGEEGIRLGGDGVMEEWLCDCGGVGEGEGGGGMEAEGDDQNDRMCSTVVEYWN